MSEQAAIDVPQAPAERGPCAWCGEPGQHDLTIRKASYTKDHHGNRQIARRATVVPVCELHNNSLVRSGEAAA